MTMPYDPAELESQAKSLYREASDRYSAELDQVRAIRARATPPMVVPVVSFQYWHCPVEDEAMELGDSTLSAAYRLLAMIDNDLGSPLGVYVGGAFISWESLQDQYETELFDSP